MKKVLQIFIVALVVYLAVHILFGLDFNPTINLITKILQLALAILLLIYVNKFFGDKKKN